MSVNVYEMVTERIIKQLEQGTIPWQKPWTGVRSGAFNRVSKKPYSLINQAILEKSGEYATFHQWKNLGGHIKKGAKSEIVVFWKIIARLKRRSSHFSDITMYSTSHKLKALSH